MIQRRLPNVLTSHRITKIRPKPAVGSVGKVRLRQGFAPDFSLSRASRGAAAIAGAGRSERHDRGAIGERLGLYGTDANYGG